MSLLHIVFLVVIIIVIIVVTYSELRTYGRKNFNNLLTDSHASYLSLDYNHVSELPNFYRPWISEENILKREEANPRAAPYIVSIMMGTDTSYKHHGAGVITNERCIITAGHVLDSIAKTKDNFHILAGCIDISGNVDEQHTQRLSIDYVVKHDDYFRSRSGQINSYDIGLIRTGESIRFTDYVQPIDWGKNSEKWQSETYFFGWGNLSRTDSPMYPSKLQRSLMPIIDCKTCSSILKTDIDDNRLCAGSLDGLYSICYGDSGGPLLQYQDNVPKLIGLASYGGTPCGQINEPSIFTKIDAFTDWIEENAIKMKTE